MIRKANITSKDVHQDRVDDIRIPDARDGRSLYPGMASSPARWIHRVPSAP